MGSGAAQKIYLVCTGGGDQKIGIHYAGLTQNTHRGTVSVNGDDIIALHTGFQNLGVGIDERDAVAFRGKLTGKGGTYFSVACNDNIHSSLLNLEKKFLILLKLFYIIAISAEKNNKDLAKDGGNYISVGKRKC
jgi:hypothetical protein